MRAQILQSEFPILHADLAGESRPAGGRGLRAFSLVEILVVVSLLSLIVLALMTVFNSTQQAFRASVTQTDVLEGGREAAQIITADLRSAVACDGLSQGNANPLLSGSLSGYSPYGVNFFVTNNAVFYTDLVQSMPGTGAVRTNLLQWFFVLGRQNTKWTAVGYIVNSASTTSLYPLYRYYNETNVAVDPAVLFNLFVLDVNLGCTNMSHLIDGVVHMVIRANDSNGVLMTNGYAIGSQNTLKNTWFTPPYPSPVGEVGFCMFSNALPASVELQLGVLEDRAIQRAESLGIPGSSIFTLAGAPTSPAQWNYLQSQAGRVHVFRQRVTIQNVDPTAYQ